MATSRDFTFTNATESALTLQFEPYGEEVSIPPQVPLLVSGAAGPDSALFWLCWHQIYYNLWDFRDSWVKLEMNGQALVDYPEFGQQSQPLEVLRIVNEQKRKSGRNDVLELLGLPNNCFLGLSISENVDSGELQIQVGSERKLFTLLRFHEYVIEANSEYPDCRIDVAHCGSHIQVSEGCSRSFSLYELRNFGRGMQEDYRCLNVFEVSL